MVTSYRGKGLQLAEPSTQAELQELVALWVPPPQVCQSFDRLGSTITNCVSYAFPCRLRVHLNRLRTSSGTCRFAAVRTAEHIKNNINIFLTGFCGPCQITTTVLDRNSRCSVLVTREIGRAVSAMHLSSISVNQDQDPIGVHSAAHAQPLAQTFRDLPVRPSLASLEAFGGFMTRARRAKMTPRIPFRSWLLLPLVLLILKPPGEC